MNLRGYVLCLCIAPLSFCALFSQGYVIDDYHVDIEIKKDGSAIVQETIQVDFDEPRHGIYRDIPLGYKSKTTSTNDAIMLTNVKVIGDPFVVINKPGLLRIRIGSANEKVRGKKQYKLTYEVLGAVEQFNDVAEFSWNIIGDQWDAKIRTASATIRYPYKIADANTDVLLNVKRKEVQLSEIKHQLFNDKLELVFPGSFNRRTGVAMALRFKNHEFPIQAVPAAVISDDYFIPKMEMEVVMDDQGVLTIVESYHVVSKSKGNAITRLISAHGRSNNIYGTIYPYPDLMTASWAGNQANISMELQDQTYQYRVAGERIPRDSRLTLSYQLGGAVSVDQDKVSMQLDLAYFDGKVAIDTIDLTVNLPSGASLNSIPELSGYISQKQNKSFIRYVRKGFLTGPIRQIFGLKGIKERDLIYVKENLYSEKIIDDLVIKVTQDKNGELEIKESILLQNKMSSANQTYWIGSQINTAIFPYAIQNPSLLTRERTIDVDVSEVHPDFRQLVDRDHQRAMNSSVSANSRFYATYSLDPIVVDKRLIIPIYFSPETPIDHISVIVENDQGDQVSDVVASDFFINDKSALKLFDHEGYQFLAIPLDDGVLASTSISFIDRLRANGRLIGSLIIAGLLYLLWYRFGRDKKYDGSMHPHPPDYMTPAEAGYLWDGKLHGRDLISLIYHWAARGLLTIEEVDIAGTKSEYFLEKQKDLPKGAFEYEKVLFDRLFTIGENRVKISSLRNSFYKTMSAATKSLKSEFERRHMYEPFTRGIGTLFVIFGFLVIIAGFVVLGIHSTKSDFSWSLPMLIIGMSMLFFGYYLPKKTALGSNYFIALQKFEKFIDEAPVSELASLYEKDSQYFQNTLAFAIVLGKAKDWAKRFDGLITAPPSYYRGSRHNQFSPMLFTDNVLTGMRTMENDFYSTPAPAANSSTYSGGRSSSFGGGGGFSGGGGFGGGGGSSW